MKLPAPLRLSASSRPVLLMRLSAASRLCSVVQLSWSSASVAPATLSSASASSSSESDIVLYSFAIRQLKRISSAATAAPSASAPSIATATPHGTPISIRTLARASRSGTFPASSWGLYHVAVTVSIASNVAVQYPSTCVLGSTLFPFESRTGSLGYHGARPQPRPCHSFPRCCHSPDGLMYHPSQCRSRPRHQRCCCPGCAIAAADGDCGRDCDKEGLSQTARRVSQNKKQPSEI